MDVSIGICSKDVYAIHRQGCICNSDIVVVVAQQLHCICACSTHFYILHNSIPLSYIYFFLILSRIIVA